MSKLPSQKFYWKVKQLRKSPLKSYVCQDCLKYQAIFCFSGRSNHCRATLFVVYLHMEFCFFKLLPFFGTTNVSIWNNNLLILSLGAIIFSSLYSSLRSYEMMLWSCFVIKIKLKSFSQLCLFLVVFKVVGILWLEYDVYHSTIRCCSSNIKVKVNGP